MSQFSLVQHVAIERTFDGDIDMGILQDGSTYLSARGLARLCGVHPSAVITQGANWRSGRRSGKLHAMLAEAGITELFFVLPNKNHAYNEAACVVFLEYYAFEAATKSETAERNFRILARGGIRAFIYGALGYAPAAPAPDKWRQLHDRLELSKVPAGFFSVFEEGAGLVLWAIRHGLQVDDHTVPDISIGTLWAKHWRENSLESKHGAIDKCDHNFPDYFPQAKSNPQRINVYPVSALGDFRTWMQTVYMPEKFPSYIRSKALRGDIPPSMCELMLKALPTLALPSR